MAVISGTTVNWGVSPRIITIPIPVLDVSIEDLQDTCQDLEDSEIGIVFPKLRTIAGGEDLGGGTSVGFTLTLNNAQVQFAGRTVATEFGAVSTSDTTGTLLNAVGGAFVTNGVSRGDTVFNNVTGAMATILSVTDNNNLVSQVLSGGARTTWLNTDTYTIYVNAQCSVTGGNLVAVDDVGATISSILQSPNTNVTLTSSSSATIQNQEQLESATFIGKEGLGVSINPLTGTDSAVYPFGTRENPCKTEDNMHAISLARGFKNVYVITNHTVTGDVSFGHVYFGDNPQTTVITLGDVATYPGKDVSNCKFQDCTVVGEFDSANIVWESIVSSVTKANGFIYKSTIVGPIVVGGTLSMEDCWTATPGANNIIDFNSTANTVGITDWSGGTIEVRNMVAGCVFGMGGTAGSLVLHSSCTGGSVNHGGAIRLKEDLSTGVSINDATTATQVWNKQVEGTFTAEEVMQIMSAALAGKASGLDTLAPVFRDINDTKDRITATTDANGNRTAITLVGS